MLQWIEAKPKRLSETVRQQALQRQQCLTKPPGSLGRLEELAVRLAAMQDDGQPALDKVRITIFAADHGVAEEGVSAFPQVVTREMVRNFAAGGAAISVLAKHLNASLEVVDAGVCHDPGELVGVVRERVGAGTANFVQTEAMTEVQLAEALMVGRRAVERARAEGAQLLIAGEMGIANTTSATAIGCALLKASPLDLAGPGTGLDQAGVRHKAEVIERALALHQSKLDSPLAVLRCLGGFEIAAITGFYLAAAQAGVPVLVDGFIATTAALVAKRLQRDADQWWFYAHASAEPGHRALMQSLDGEPLLDLGMRLGEGSGAAVAVPLLHHACALHNEMATFEQAGVSGKA